MNIIAEGIITRRESKKTEVGEIFTQMMRAIKGEDIANNVDTESINDMDKLAVFILENRLIHDISSFSPSRLKVNYFFIELH
ncbi:hypothetical protein YN1HA_9510 [Sulfurisphaera ohwakuensis]